jgi:hypothetical protein
VSRLGCLCVRVKTCLVLLQEFLFHGNVVVGDAENG